VTPCSWESGNFLGTWHLSIHWKWRQQVLAKTLVHTYQTIRRLNRIGWHSDNDSVSYYEVSRFEFLSGHRLSPMKFSLFYPGPSDKFWDSIYNRPLPLPSKPFPIHHKITHKIEYRMLHSSLWSLLWRPVRTNRRAHRSAQFRGGFSVVPRNKKLYTCALYLENGSRSHICAIWGSHGGRCGKCYTSI
jgi:hypothetical protein